MGADSIINDDLFGVRRRLRVRRRWLILLVDVITVGLVRRRDVTILDLDVLGIGIVSRPTNGRHTLLLLPVFVIAAG